MTASTEAKRCSETACPYAPVAQQSAAPAGRVPAAA